MIRLFAGLVLLSAVIAAPAAEWVNIDGREAHPTRVLAKLKPSQNIARLGAAAPNFAVKRAYSQIPGLAAIEIKDKAALKNAVAGNADPAAGLKKTIADLTASGLFEYVEPDYLQHASLSPTDRRFLDGTLWGLNNTGLQGGVIGADVNVTRAWDITTGDTNMIVAVIDTGVNYNHRDLNAQMWRNPGEIPGNNIDDDNNGYVDDVFGINAVNDNGDPMDLEGHGTHVAGTIGAAANDGNEHVGVIWKVQIMALRFLGPGGGFNSDQIECINYMMANNIKLSNNSYGGYGFSQAQYDAMAAAGARGHLFICAAGNDSNDNDVLPAYPASHDLDNIISVAALDRRDQLASFSNYGINSVDIGAPGVEIFSTWFGADTAYNTIDGTSMASPHVAGGAALLWSAEPTADYLRIRERLLQRATPIPALSGRVTTGGRLDLFRAISGNVDGVLELAVTPSGGSYFPAGATRDIRVRVTDDFNVNNAVVAGRFNGVNLTFRNDGIAPDVNSNDGIYTTTVTMPAQPGVYSLSVDAQAPGKQPASVAVSYEILRSAQNDFFLQAAKIPALGGIRESDNRLATPEPGAQSGGPTFGPDLGEPLHAGISNTRSLWWSWSTPSATSVIVDAAGTSFDDDAVLGVYTGASVSALTEIGSARAAANGPNGTRAPFVKFNAQPNLTYWIAVAQSQFSTNSPGRVVVRVEPGGDIDTTAPVVRVTNYLSGAFIRSATNTIRISGVADDPPPSASGIASVQYRVNGDLTFQAASGTTNWISGPIVLTNGINTIYLTGYDRADNQAAVTVLTLNYIPQELSNDLFGNATTLTGTSGLISATNTSAAKEFGEPAHGNNQGGHSLWWTFTPPSDGILALSTEGSSFDTLMGLYTVNDPVTDRNVQSAISVAQSDDTGDLSFSEISVAVERGRLYYIAVDGYAGQTGTAVVNYNFASVPVFNLTTSAGAGGTISPDTGTFPSESAVTVRATPERFKQFRRFLVASSGATNEVLTNPYTFVLAANTAIVAEFENKVFTDDFETGLLNKLPYQIPGNHWTVESVTTNAAGGGSTRVARVAQGLPDSTVASLILVTNLFPGTASFEFRVNTETNYDKFVFLVDGREVGVWSGNIPWTTFEFEVAPKNGPTRLEWRFTKDVALSEPNEFVGIDNLDLRIAPPLPDSPITMQIAAGGASLSITVTGPANSDFALESSTNLTNWSPTGLERNSGAAGRTTFTLEAPAETQRYFRVIRL